jgi:hypothetical protein
MDHDNQVSQLQTRNRQQLPVDSVLIILAVLPLLMAAGRLLTVMGTVQAEKYEVLGENGEAQDLVTLLESKIKNEIESKPRVVAGEIQLGQNMINLLRQTPNGSITAVQYDSQNRVIITFAQRFSSPPTVTASPVGGAFFCRVESSTDKLEITPVDRNGTRMTPSPLPLFKMHFIAVGQ